MASRPAQAEKAYSFENLQGVDGRSYSLSSFDDKQILVVIFSGNGCPTAKATEPRIMEIQRDYAEKGVQIVLIFRGRPLGTLVFPLPPCLRYAAKKRNGEVFA